jgi:predicted phage terminase large subunit-like protein
LQRIIVAVDPSGTKGDDGGDHIGIIVAGLGIDGDAYILDDCSLKAPPAVWGKAVINAFDRHGADCIVAEVNFGGAMVQAVVQAAATEAKLRVRFKEVRASRGKVVRAEPVAALYETGRVHHCGAFPQLEDQMISFTTSGYMGDGSPDRADALIWALSELFPRVVTGNRPDEKLEVLANGPLLGGPRRNGPRPGGAPGEMWRPAWK